MTTRRRVPSLYDLHVENWSGGCGSAICAGARKVCLARGKVPCDVVFIGEAPGASEDAIGLPFVGPAGHLLDIVIERSVPEGVPYALTNLVGCIPLDEYGGKSGAPPDEAIKCCGPRLAEFVGLCRPRLVVCVGSLSRDWLDEKRKHSIVLPPMGDGRPIPRVWVKHPAAILRSSTAVRDLDIQRCVVTIANAIEEHCK
jgi:uracil-DNA glycosylase